MTEAIGTRKPQVKLLEHCETGELVRGNFLGKMVWAIVCNRGNEFLNVVTLTGENAPYAFNAHSHNQPMVVACLNFGKNFQLIPDYTGPCELRSTEPYKSKVGNLMLAEKDSILVADNSKKMMTFVHLDTDAFLGEPGGLLAVFEHWSLWINDLEGHPVPTKVLEHKANVTLAP
jgi:hypothetical protein